MELTIAEALERGIDFHKAGKFQEADRMYTAILKIQPEHADANHNLGTLAVQLGKVAQALPLFEKALQAEKATEQFWVSYLAALINLGQVDTAQKILDRAKWQGVRGEKLDQITEIIEKKQKSVTSANRNSEPPQEQIQALMESYQRGHYLEMSTKSEQMRSGFPNSPTVINLQGMAYLGQGQFQQAIACFHEVLRLQPTFTAGHINLGNALAAQGDLNGAAANYQSALRLNPKEPALYNNLGNLQKELGNLKGALKSYQQALQLKPDFAEIHANMGTILADLGDTTNAISYLQKAIQLQPAQASHYKNLGFMFHQLGDLEGALANNQKAVEIRPDYAEAWNNLGYVFHELGNQSGALSSYRKALVLKPDYAEAQNNLGVMLMSQGDLVEAEASYLQALENKPSYTEAHWNLARVRKHKGVEPQIQQLHQLVNQPGWTNEDLAYINFSLGKVYEDIGDFAKSFGFLEEANHHRKVELGYEIAKEEQNFAGIRRQVEQIDLETTQVNPDQVPLQQTPVFILGMPRSGTTLVEQVLSSHSQVFGAGELKYLSNRTKQLGLLNGELSKEKLKSLREYYLRDVARFGSLKPYLTDKMPGNFPFIGMICSALPEAKIIHVQRDAMATCWSIYKHNFTVRGHGYAYDLHTLAAYYRMYVELMAFWREKFPEKIYELNYEALTENQEQQTRDLLAYIGLEWEDACLEFEKNKRVVRTTSNVQIRQKMYRGSSEQWKNYEPFLGELKEALAGIS